MKTPDGPQIPPDEGTEPEETEIERLRRENAEFAAAKDAARPQRTAELEAKAKEKADARAKHAAANRFDPEKLSHKNDAAFVAVADATVPKEAATWQHPKNEKILFCYGLGQMIVSKELDLKRASRDIVLEWLYVRIWMPLNMGGACKNIEAASVILRLYMILPRRVATQIIQKTVVNAGRKQISSPSAAPVDGNFGPKTRGAIYSELCSHYEQTEKAISGQVYAKFQEYAGSDPGSWGPVLQAYATDRF